MYRIYTNLLWICRGQSVERGVLPVLRGTTISLGRMYATIVTTEADGGANIMYEEQKALDTHIINGNKFGEELLQKQHFPKHLRSSQNAFLGGITVIFLMLCFSPYTYLVIGATSS